MSVKERYVALIIRIDNDVNHLDIAHPFAVRFWAISKASVLESLVTIKNWDVNIISGGAEKTMTSLINVLEMLLPRSFDNDMVRVQRLLRSINYLKDALAVWLPKLPAERGATTLAHHAAD